MHATCQSATIGAESLANFTAWLRANGKRGMLGELGAGANATCDAAIDATLDHIDYFMTLEPQGTIDAPQLATLSGHL